MLILLLLSVENKETDLLPTEFESHDIQWMLYLVGFF